MVPSFYNDQELMIDHIVVDPGLIRVLELKKQEKDNFFQGIIVSLNHEFIVTTQAFIQQLEQKINEEVRKLSVEQRETYLREINTSMRPTFDSVAMKEIQAMLHLQASLVQLVDVRQRYQAARDGLIQWKETTWQPALKKITVEIISELSNPLDILQDQEKKALDPHWQAMQAGIAESLATRASAADLVKHLPHIRDQFLKMYHKNGDTKQAMQQVINPLVQRNTTIVCAGKAMEFFKNLPATIQKKLGGGAIRFAKIYAESENCRMAIDKYIAKLENLNVGQEISSLQVSIAEMGGEIELLVKAIPEQVRQLPDKIAGAARDVISLLMRDNVVDEKPEPGSHSAPRMER